MRCSTACGISTALLFFLEAACAALCAFCLGGMAEEQGNKAWLGMGRSVLCSGGTLAAAAAAGCAGSSRPECSMRNQLCSLL